MGLKNCSNGNTVETKVCIVAKSYVIVGKRLIQYSNNSITVQFAHAYKHCLSVQFYVVQMCSVVGKVFVMKGIYLEKGSRLFHCWRRGKHARLSTSSR